MTNIVYGNVLWSHISFFIVFHFQNSRALELDGIIVIVRLTYEKTEAHRCYSLLKIREQMCDQQPKTFSTDPFNFL